MYIACSELATVAQKCRTCGNFKRQYLRVNKSFILCIIFFLYGIETLVDNIQKSELYLQYSCFSGKCKEKCISSVNKLFILCIIFSFIELKLYFLLLFFERLKLCIINSSMLYLFWQALQCTLMIALNLNGITC